jgi:CRP-like cAMP-binding protein
MPRHSPNRFLKSLTSSDLDLLVPHLRLSEMEQGVVLVAANAPVERVYFPSGGFISLVTTLAGGDTLEAAMIGLDSFFGPMAALDGGLTLSDAIVQLPGCAFTMDSAARQSPTFRSLIVKHERALFTQALQSAACCAFHNVEARLARWLLQARDISGGGDRLPLTQEFLVQMLGARRSSVSLVTNKLQRAGLIRYSRGLIEIVDINGLKGVSCECYGAIKAHYDLLAIPACGVPANPCLKPCAG